MGYHVGCLDVSVFPIGKAAEVQCKAIGKAVDVSCYKVGGTADVLCERIGESIDVSCVVLHKPIDVSCFTICSLNNYLRVSTETLWLTPDMIAEQFDIYSNVSWEIN